MRRGKIYYAEAKAVWVKKRETNANVLLVFSKELASKIARDFLEIGKIAFQKDKEGKEEYSVFAKQWGSDIQFDKGLYQLKLQIVEGTEKYPDPEICILEKTYIAALDGTMDCEIMGTSDFRTPITQVQAQVAQSAQPTQSAPTQASSAPQTADDDFLF